tara:strand:- start:577 stop:1032 length:456 start_codon:yes stop_codon:yes gene_type:complete
MQLIGVLAQVAAISAQNQAAQQAAVAHEQSGKDQARAYKEQAEQSESAAKDRELERLVKLRKVKASQRAYWAAAGIDSATGSPTTVASRSYQMFELDQGADLINTRSQIRSLNNSADAAIRMGRIKARHSLLTSRVRTLGSLSQMANTWNT